MYQDDELVMISALQHYLFCPRQCALIHVENLWHENFLTATGRELHKHVDSFSHETRQVIHTATSLRLFSRQLGVTGIADLVEFHKDTSEFDEKGTKISTRLPELKGFWKPFPIEYKRGKPKSHRADEVQLCAQAICLEEMLQLSIENGALFYGETRRRTEVHFDNELRRLTEQVANNVHNLLQTGELPEAKFDKNCEACSLVELCNPKISQKKPSAKQWLDNYLKEIINT